ncbi:MAG: hypothetical protein AAGK32_10585, partial [Actinomycetota bacterium]
DTNGEPEGTEPSPFSGSEITLVVAGGARPGEQIPLRLRVVRPDGRHFDAPVPDRFVDGEARVVDVGGMRRSGRS